MAKKSADLRNAIQASAKAPAKLAKTPVETDIQALLAEAINDRFAKYGKPEIAQVEGNSSQEQ
jgi:hypothetical protein